MIGAGWLPAAGTVRLVAAALVTLLFTLLFTSSDPGVATARADDRHPAETHDLCWRGRPLPECRTFLLTEFGALARLDEYPYQGSAAPEAFTLELGWMRNVTRHDAVGVSLRQLLSDPEERSAVRLRYRRWLSRRVSAEVMPGVVFSGEGELMVYDPPGLMVGVALNVGDIVALTAESEYARYTDHLNDPQNPRSRSEVTWRAGARFGSGLGLVGALALAGVIIVMGAAIGAGG